MPKDSGDLVDEHFHREDQEKIARMREQAAAAKAAAQAEARRELHWHHCGKCGHEMETQLFRGVEIEICPNCGAVLLDPGELEALAGGDSSGIVDFVGELFRFRKARS